jgi:phage tail-like protein
MASNISVQVIDDQLAARAGDVNNTLHFLLREPDEFDHRSSNFIWDSGRKALIMAQQQELRLPESNTAAALAAWAAARPLVIDAFGQLGRISNDGARIEYNSGRGFRGLLDGELGAVTAPAGDFVDLTLGGDGRLAAPFESGADHGLLVFHLGHRWQTEVRLPERPLRAAVDRNNRIWVVGPTTLFLCEGEPLPQPYQPSSDRFEPMALNPHPLRVLFQQHLNADEAPLAICVDDEKVYVLVHNGAGSQSILSRSLVAAAGSPIRRHPISDEVPFVVDLTVVAPGRLAALAPREAADTAFERRDCPVIQLTWDTATDTGEAILIHERYPMLSQAQARFAGGIDGQARYQAVSDVAGVPARPRELHPLQRPRYPSAAAVTLTTTLDSGRPDTLWHRIYMDGCIPSGCRITLYVKTFDNPARRGATPFIRQPELLWTPLPSERPFAASLSEPMPNESGLFELLIQRDTGAVRRMNGRYLQLRIAMESDGRHTPVIHALRVYYPRFSYQEVYLPDHIRQEERFDPNLPAAPNVPANGADTRERFLAAFEGMLTPLEGRVASAEVLLNPDVTPEPNLPWLAELMGQTPSPHWPAGRRRTFISYTGALQRWRGTLAGVQLALDIATDGAVGRGQIVLVENFRLRRTMATILGINMDDAEHPLTLGTGMSGNSIVGDSLILSEKDARTFLALFSPDLATEGEKKVVQDFFDHYANQVTVLLHGDARRLRAAVTETLADQMPAHLQYTIFETDHPFVLGLSPLLAVDTFLEKEPPARQVTLDDTFLGKEGVLKNPVAFSPQDASRRQS